MSSDPEIPSHKLTGSKGNASWFAYQLTPKFRSGPTLDILAQDFTLSVDGF